MGYLASSAVNYPGRVIRLNLAVIRLRSWGRAVSFGPIFEPVLRAKRRQVSVTGCRVQNQVRFGLTEPYHYSPACFAKRVWEAANHDRPPLLVSHISEYRLDRLRPFSELRVFDHPHIRNMMDSDKQREQPDEAPSSDPLLQGRGPQRQYQRASHRRHVMMPARDPRHVG